MRAGDSTKSRRAPNTGRVASHDRTEGRAVWWIQPRERSPAIEEMKALRDAGYYWGGSRLPDGAEAWEIRETTSPPRREIVAHATGCRGLGRLGDAILLSGDRERRRALRRARKWRPIMSTPP